jgi:hypothetical protein
MTAAQLRDRAAEYFRKAETTATARTAAAFVRLGARFAAYAAERESEEERTASLAGMTTIPRHDTILKRTSK